MLLPFLAVCIEKNTVKFHIIHTLGGHPKSRFSTPLPCVSGIVRMTYTPFPPDVLENKKF